jgi:hypothetical protein
MALILALLLAFTAARVVVVPQIPRIRETAYRIYPRTTSVAFQLLRRVKRRR